MNASRTRAAILYRTRTGCQWAYLPHEPPPKSAAYYCFAAWWDDGVGDRLASCLRGRPGRPFPRRATARWQPGGVAGVAGHD
ncbi:transposase [Streptomyces mirabilis]